MIKYKIQTSDSKGAQLSGKQKEARLKDIKRVHDCLYKFSIQKAMELMKNKYYVNLFKVYYKAIISGDISMSETMQRNQEAYHRAFRMLLGENF